MPALRSFASSDRFLSEIASPATLRPGYVLLGDEAFLYQRCRQGVLATLAPEGTRDFSLHDLDLADTSIFDVLDLAQTPSLMAPFQVLFVRNLKQLYGRGSKKEEFAAIDAYFRSPNPAAVLLFVADHLRLPTDLRKMDYQDKERYDRIRETLGDWCGFVELARVDEADAVRWVIASAEARAVKFDPDAARELVDSLGADMMLASSELDKLCLYVSPPAVPSPRDAVIPSDPERAQRVEGESKDLHKKEAVILSEAHERAAGESNGAESKNLLHNESVILSGPERTKRVEGESKDLPQNESVILSERSESKDLRSPSSVIPLARNRITLGDVETMVLAAKQRSLYELTDAISLRDRTRALLLLHGLLNSSGGGEDAAIGHLYMLARTFRQMLIILEKNVRDSRAIWAVLWQGFRMPPFAAEDLIRQARRYKSRSALTRALRQIARADLELRSSPVNKLLVLERLVIALATEPAAPTRFTPTHQFAMEL